MKVVRNVYARFRTVSRPPWKYLGAGLLVILIAIGAIVFGRDYTNKDYESPDAACLICNRTGEPVPNNVAPTAQTTRVPTALPALAPPQPTFDASRAQPAVNPTQASIAGAKPLPPSHARRSGCIGCHLAGPAGTPRLPDDHKVQSDDACAACHKLP